MRPVLLNLFGEAIYSYPLFVGASWGLGYSLAKSNWLSLVGSEKKFNMAFVGAFLSAWIGAKVFFLLFSMPKEQMKFAGEASFWVGGGFVFYGGLIFALAYMLLAMKLMSVKPAKLAVFVPPLFIGHALGRVGCFLAGCCFGKQCPLDFIDHHPVQLYESISLVVLYFVANNFLFKKKSYELVLLSYLCGYSLVRFVLELFRDDKIRGIYMGLSTSQWTSLFLFSCGIILAFFSRRSKRNSF